MCSHLCVVSYFTDNKTQRILYHINCYINSTKLFSDCNCMRTCYSLLQLNSEYRQKRRIFLTAQISILWAQQQALG